MIRDSLGGWMALGLLVLPLGCGRAKLAPQVPQVQTQPAEKALIVSGQHTRVYHFCTCAYARDIPEAEALGFSDPAEAEKAGRIPCAVCRPRERFAQYTKQQPPEGQPPSGPAAPAAPEPRPPE